jgi:hypothetical protein
MLFTILILTCPGKCLPYSSPDEDPRRKTAAVRDGMAIRDPIAEGR